MDGLNWLGGLATIYQYIPMYWQMYGIDISHVYRYIIYLDVFGLDFFFFSDHARFQKYDSILTSVARRINADRGRSPTFLSSLGC